MKIKPLICMFAFCACFATAAQNRMPTQQPAQETYIPQYNNYNIAWIDGKIFIKDVLVNNRRSTFKFDTGNNQTLSMNFGFASRLGFDTTKITSRNFYMATGKKSVRSAVVKIDSMFLGSVGFFNFNADIQNNLNSEKELLRHGNIRNYAGLMGVALFKNCEIYIDLPNRIISIIETDVNGNCLRKEMMEPHTVVPFSYVRGVPVIDVFVGNRRLRMIFDTGAQRSLISKKYEKEMQPWLKNRNDKSAIGAANSQKIRATKYNFRSIRIGNRDFKNSTVFFSDMSHYAKDNIDGYLGIDVLKNTRFAINFKKQEIYFY